MEIELKVNGKAALAGDVLGKTFSTGSVGLYLPGKVMINGYSYQASITLTAIGSKDGKVSAKDVLESLKPQPVASK